jgi:hypothetical protein
MRPLNEHEINHLRKLLAWCECEIGQDPELFIDTLRKIAPVCVTENNSEQARDIVTKHYNKLKSQPQYVRAAIKSLKKHLAEIDSGVEIAGNFEELTQKRIEK